MSYIIFARWFGVISTLLALGILFNLEDAKEMARGMVKTETGYIMGGVLPIIFGSLAIIDNNAFDMGRHMIVTMIGIGMTAIGAYRVLFVSHWKRVIHQHLDQVPSLFSLFGLMFGVVLLYIGFFSQLVR